MIELGITSIFPIIIDNTSSSDTAIEYLKKMIDKMGIILENEFIAHEMLCTHTESYCDYEVERGVLNF
jgi:hypothetical protein